MNIRRIVFWGTIVFITYYVLTAPAGAAGFVHQALALLKQAGSSIAIFLNSL